MRVAFIPLNLFSVCFCCCLGADEQKPTPRQRFLALNPDYDKRVAKFYRSEYLPISSRAMTKAIADAAFKEADADRILEALIDDFLKKFVDGGGTITRVERARLVRAMDQSVSGLVKDAAALARYRQWRDTSDREVNALTFLMMADDVSFTLHKGLVEAGWTVKAHKVAELERFAGYFGQVPDHVLVFENPALSKGGKRASLLVLSFHAERVRELVLDRVGPFRSDDRKLPAIDFFWQASSLVYFAAEGDFPREQAQLASFIRSQMVGQARFEGKRVPID